MSRKNSAFLDSSSSSEVSSSIVAETTEKLKKGCGIQGTISRFGRRSSSTVQTKPADDPKPSVSSMEDLTTTPFRSFDSNPPGVVAEKEGTTGAANETAQSLSAAQIRRKSVTSFMTRKSSTSNNTTPLISVSSVSEQNEEKSQQILIPLVPDVPVQDALGTASAAPIVSKKCAKMDSVDTVRREAVSVGSNGDKSNFTALVAATSLCADPALVAKDNVNTSSSGDVKTDDDKMEKKDPSKTPNEVCPWEDE